MHFFFLALVLMQLFHQTNAEFARKSDAELYHKLINSIFPLPRFGPEENRSFRNHGVHRFGRFGPHCGLKGECTVHCICCGGCVDNVCEEPYNAIDMCAVSERSSPFLPQKVQAFELPSDFPDVVYKG